MKTPVIYGACLAAMVMVLGGCGSGRDSLTIAGSGDGGGSTEPGIGGEAGQGDGGSGETGGQAGQGGGETGGEAGEGGQGGGETGGQAGQGGGETGGQAGQGGGETGGQAGQGGGETGGGGAGGAGGADDCKGWPTDNSECHPVKQCGCPNTGDTACKVEWSDGTSECRTPVTPELEPGESCQDYQDCAEGTCLGDIGGTNKVCSEYCLLGAPCANGGRCLEFFIDGQRVSNVGTCTHQCQPWDRNGCGDGLSCDVLLDSGKLQSGYSVCSHPGQKGQGKPCDKHTDCLKNLGCVPVRPLVGDDSLSCRKWCRTNTDCNPGDKCEPFDPEVKIGDTRVGYCTITSAGP